MRISICTIVCLFLCLTSNAQNFEGIAIYMTSSNITTTMDSTKVATKEQKELDAMIRLSMQKEYELRFNRIESSYKEIESLKKAGDNDIKIIGLGSGTEGGLYKNTKTKRIVESRDLFGKLFLVKDTMETIDWQLTSETRQIGKYKCNKAFYIIKGKKFNETITAWYTTQIPVSTGPASYWGLPGLILEVSNGSLNMICSKIVLNPEKAVVIKEPTKGKAVSTEEYDIIYKEKVMEMKEMYKNKRKKKGN